MLNFISENWYLILVAIAALAVAGYFIYDFIKKPTNEQLTKVREWLLYAVAEAEKVLGVGTGQIKLRYVYDMFLTKFPSLAKVIPFETFSKMVDDALAKFKELLQENNKLKDYINQ